MREVVIISGKGGTGKTTLTASLAALWQNKVLVDCDVDAADLHLLLQPEIQKKSDFYSGVRPVIDPELCNRCGKCIEVCKFQAITSDFAVNEIDCEGCAVCYFFCPIEAISMKDRHSGEWYLSETRYGPLVHARLGIAEENSGKLVSLLRRQAKILAEDRGMDTILVDGSPGIGCPVISSITGATLVVVVTEPTISGVHDTDRVFNLTDHFQIPASVVINKADLNEEMSQKIEAEAARRGAALLGRMSYDPVVTRAMVRGKTLVEFDGGSVKNEIQEIGKKLWARIKS